ncbi:MAG: hypothetical protein GWO87_02495 [Xanthomonadaceae bacterium]|nr:hypothetical protein [Rhodospirillaceae bacterium]NIA18034.1 hypothetical protein [Xanthomonadaceae bacterium]
MKIILSRKGFDSDMGGHPSPIINKKIISMPIPEENGNYSYNELQIDSNLIKQLYNNFDLKRKCHLDPDINKAILKNRPKNWKALFGQTGNAQSHLQNENQDIKKNDIFLFFGWFRKTERTKNKIIFTGPDMHVIFGYFQIDKILKVKDIQWNKENEWMKYHDHINEKYINNERNTIYVAKERLSFNKKLLGAGIFDYNKNLVLTKNGYLRSRWELPKIFKSVNITYHSKNSWKISKKTGEEYFQSAGRGQEFVIEKNKRIKEWAINLINDCIPL